MADFQPLDLDDLEVTWWIMDTEPEMDDIYERAGESLEPMVERLQMHLFQDANNAPRLFLARYELPKYQEDFQHADGVFLPEARGFVDFLAGFPIECVEMLGHMGEYSVKEEDNEFDVLPGDSTVPPMPKELFEGIPDERLLLNTCFFEEEEQGENPLETENLSGEPEPSNLHWWVRTNVKDEDKFPVPGEFMGLAVRIMPGKPWGMQKSSPFIYSGNWMDTVYLSSARVTEVLPDKDPKEPWAKLRVQWRDQEVEVNPSDFAEYQVDDRVTVLKEVDVDKPSQTWDDEDVKEFDEEKWIAIPLSFYGLEEEG
jgi:hypothetical protein